MCPISGMLTPLAGSTTRDVVKSIGCPMSSLATRTANTVVEMREGRTLAIAGLLQIELEGRTNRIPGLGDLEEVPADGLLVDALRFLGDLRVALDLDVAAVPEPVEVLALVSHQFPEAMADGSVERAAGSIS